MNEIWKDVYFIENGIEYDYRGLYQVSNLGRVKGLKMYVKGKNGSIRTKKEKMLKNGLCKNNYSIVVLSKNGKNKTFYVHRLVAHMFIYNDDKINKTQVNHIDENKENNCIENLEWCTPNYNSNYGTRNKRLSNTFKKNNSFKDNKNAIGCLVERWNKQGNLIDIKYNYEYVKMGFHSGHISACCKGKQKSHKGFIWKYHKNK